MLNKGFGVKKASQREKLKFSKAGSGGNNARTLYIFWNDTVLGG